MELLAASPGLPLQQLRAGERGQAAEVTNPTVMGLSYTTAHTAQWHLHWDKPSICGHFECHRAILE